MKAYIMNPRTKLLAQTGNFQSAYTLLERLRNRFSKCNEATKATHIANYHRLEMSKTEKGSAFLDKLAVVLSSVGEELSDGANLSKLIESTSANPAYRDLARSIYSTPGINYSTAISLFGGYERTDSPTVNAIICNYCNKKGHNISKCRKRQRRDCSNLGGNKQYQSRVSGKRNKKRYPCVICKR